MPTALPQEIGQILMLMAKDFQGRLDADLRERGIPGISQRHRAIFLHLGRYGASRSVDLAQAAGIRPQSMTVIINELEDMGLVERRPDPRDSRAKLIDFTGRGRRLIVELSRSTETVWGQYRDIAGEDKLRDIFTGLGKLLSHGQGESAHSQRESAHSQWESAHSEGETAI
jgi:DNA-binding MarR family transcriptional regulator